MTNSFPTRRSSDLLQEHLMQHALAARRAREALDLGVDVEARRFAAIECVLGGLTRHAAQMQTIEQHFRDADFVVRDLAVCLADGAHQRKGRIEKLRLDLGRGADDRNLEYARSEEHTTEIQSRMSISEA